jgi:hypothetical protein
MVELREEKKEARALLSKLDRQGTSKESLFLVCREILFCMRGLLQRQESRVSVLEWMESQYESPQEKLYLWAHTIRHAAIVEMQEPSDKVLCDFVARILWSGVPDISNDSKENHLLGEETNGNQGHE